MQVRVILFLVYSVSFVVCNTFNNTEIEIKFKKSDVGKLVVISGRIEDIQPSFEGQVVEEIVVRDQEITRLNNEAVRNMQTLNKITFDTCEIREIDAEAFGDLPTLKEIIIKENRIRKLHGEVFAKNPIEDLYLGFNEIEELERFKGVHTVKRLFLSFNQLKDLPEDLFADCVELQQINLNANKLSRIPANLFRNNEKLTFINLSRNKFTTLKLQPFSHLKHLNELFFPGNAITNLSLHSSFTLKSFNLNDNFLNFIPNSVIENLNVGSLFLGNNPLLCTCIAPIKTMLSRSGGKLRDGIKLTEIEFLDCVFPQVLVEECWEGKIDVWATKKFFGKMKNRKGFPYSRIKIFEEIYI